MTDTTTTPREDLVGVPEVAKRLNVSKRIIYNAVKDKSLSAYMLGKQLRFSEAQIAQFLHNHTHNGD